MVQLLDNIHHYYGSRLILEAIHLGAEPGQIIGLMGPSGCGKTTLLNVMAGLLSPTAGTVHVTPMGTAYVFQEPRLFPWYTVVENIALGLKAQGISRQQRLQRAYQLAKTVGLAEAVSLYPPQLSGGMKQRVNLARAFAINPQLLLLDEPFSSLDIGTRQQLQQLVVTWVQQQQATAVLVTHDLTEASVMADHLMVLCQCPARIVYRWCNQRPPHQRDPAYIYQTLSELQTLPEIAASFNLTSVNVSTIRSVTL
ncbi:abc transporter [Leptolyngbya sp. Heron Island J]|uniref:ABC transporter ATP-binding protein n=1 Tax=Leptolyngbya sp. Heron Island J TaxID=1385935 RepID=UPI0003B982EA|nr:ATP-binding cassette domain-containing protein [Leptolyngbya sp. Heron Island J]ESA34039.1 abc transporter [Leptolyngbya sp. Heron Island J]